MSKYFRGVGYLTPLLFLFSSSLYAQGLFTKFDKIYKDQKDTYDAYLKETVNNNFDIDSIKDVKQVKLDYSFLSYIIFNSPSRYVSLANIDSCAIYDLLNTNLLKSPKGEIQTIVFTFEDRKGKVKTHSMPKNKFFRLIAYKQCPKIETFKKHFALGNIRNTLATIRIPIPKSKDQCMEITQNFRSDIKTIHLCNVIEKVRKLPEQTRKFKNLSKSNIRLYKKMEKEVQRNKSFRKIIPNDSFEYLQDLCLNIEKPDQYCNGFFRKNFWKQFAQNEINLISYKNYCSDNGRNYKNARQRAKCANTLERNPQLCHFINDGYKGLAPRQNCNLISIGLSNSRLYSQYNDCPGNTGNESVTTLSRILNHFLKDSPPKDLNSCELNSTYPVAKFNGELNEHEFWKIQLCYDDKIHNKQVCYPTVLGTVPNSPLSLDKVVEKILARLKGFNPGDETCKVITQDEYKPRLLEFKSGCFIIKDRDQCLGTNCGIKIFYADEEFKNYTAESKLNFDFLPMSFINENKSMLKSFSRTYKKEVKEIRNISTFLRIFNEKKNSILMGVGCAEDLLPSFFKMRFLNQCTEMPFIVDGYLESDKIYSMVLRTSMDQIQAPRIIPWTYIFSSVKRYQTRHPLNLWSLYAIY